MAEKSLDRKLAALKKDINCGEFIIADAKDADMAYGISAPGKSPEMHHDEARYRTLDEYREQIRRVITQGLVDIVLMSASTNEVLTIEERLFDNSHITPAARANDTTDIHVVRYGTYHQHPSRPFQSATIDHIQCGKETCEPDERIRGANLGLYSITLNNDIDADYKTLNAFKEFRIEAEKKGFRYFLEVFDPNTPYDLEADQIGAFVNDHIVRSLAGVTRSGMPLFLKMVYHGPKFTEELAGYSKDLIVGILGGGSGTTYDAFKLISEAQKYGARVALFGRKINNAEHQLSFIHMLRMIVDGDVSPEEAVRAYHGVLQELGIRPYRSLEEDMTLQTPVMSYGGGGTSVVIEKPVTGTPAGQGRNRKSTETSTSSNNEPDWSKMTPAEKMDYNKKRRDQIFG
jgi:hypothetical protein